MIYQNTTNKYINKRNNYAKKINKYRDYTYRRIGYTLVAVVTFSVVV